MKKRYPLSRPAALGRERDYLADVLASAHWAGGGPYTLRCEAAIDATLKSGTSMLVPSGTAALELCALVLGLGAGDEVIMPSFTFSSCANAVVLRGATPVFVDIRPDTLNLDERRIEEAITSRTRAILIVHYAGVCCNIDAFEAIATKHALPIIEDAAQAYLSSYRGRAAGALGTVGALSFHETKNVTCGEGGVFTVSSPALWEQAEIIRDKGTNRSRFLKGSVDKYSWVALGSSFLASEFQAAVLLAQLERSIEVTQHRMELWNRYAAGLADLERRGLVQLPHVPPECVHNAHIFWFIMPDEAKRDAALKNLRARGIGAAFHFVPLHSSEGGMRYGRIGGKLETTVSVAGGLIRLPLTFDMREADVDAIVAETIEVVESAHCPI